MPNKDRYNIQLQIHIEKLFVIDHNNLNKLFVFGEDETWVKNTFCRIRDVLEQIKTSNKIVYSSWFEMIIQLVAVFAIVASCIKASNHFSQYSQMQYAPVYAFIALFLLFSNAWTYFARWLIHLRGRIFPSVGFGCRYKLATVFRSVGWFIILGIAAWSIQTLMNFVFLK